MAVANINKRESPLSQEAVVEASMRIAREQGLKAVTMRAIAADLDVTPMALYYHVENKDQLIALIAEAVLKDTLNLEVGADGWEAALRDHLMSQWDTMTRYPGLAGYMIQLPTLGTTREGYRYGSAFFEEAGFPARQAQLAWSFAFTYIHGRLSVDARFDRNAASDAGLDRIKAREHVAFGVEAVIIALRAILEDPLLAETADAHVA